VPDLAAVATRKRALAAACPLHDAPATEGDPMKNMLLISILVLAAFAGCSKKSGSTCEDVFEHTLTLVPAEFKEQLESGKAKAIEKCEKMSAEAQKCALDAKTMEELQKCPRS
jgi:hypothetical protein